MIIKDRLKDIHKKVASHIIYLDKNYVFDDDNKGLYSKNHKVRQDIGMFLQYELTSNYTIICPNCDRIVKFIQKYIYKTLGLISKEINWGCSISIKMLREMTSELNKLLIHLCR